MKDVSQQGRTVLFVSHNMGAIKSLCNKAIHLKNGKLENEGNVDFVLKQYYSENERPIFDNNLELRKDRKGEGFIIVSSVEMTNRFGVHSNVVNAGEAFSLVLKTIKKTNFVMSGFHAALIIKDAFGDRITTISTDYFKKKIITQDENKIVFEINKCQFSKGTYAINTLLWHDSSLIDDVESAFTFQVVDNDYYGNGVPQGQNIDKIFIDFSCNVG